MLIWDADQLRYVNLRRAERGVPLVPIVKKHEDVNLGIRASLHMTAKKCLQSTMSPSSNEFIFIWLYAGFLSFFTVQLFLLITKSPYLELQLSDSFAYIILAESTITISITASLVFTIFYSISELHKRILRKVDIACQLMMITGIIIVLFAAEL